jgi:hypothetical protein
MADWNGLDFRRRLASADRFNDCAMRRALRDLNTPGSRSSASLFLETAADHLRTRGAAAPFLLRTGAELREADLEVDFRLATADSCYEVQPASQRRPWICIGDPPKGLRELSDPIFALAAMLLERAGTSRELPSGAEDPGLIVAASSEALDLQIFIAALARHRASLQSTGQKLLPRKINMQLPQAPKTGGNGHPKCECACQHAGGIMRRQFPPY